MTRATGKSALAWRPMGRTARNGATHEFAAPLSGGLQTRLQRSRPRAMRRHATRKAIRWAVLATVDFGAALLSFSLCRVLGAGLLQVLRAPATNAQQFPALSFVSISVLLSLLLSGAYARGSQAQ